MINMVQKLTTSHSYDVLKTRPKRSGDTRMWTEIYPRQVGIKFVVDDWVVWLVGILMGVGAVGAGIGGFYIGQKYGTFSSIKNMITKIIPPKIWSMIPVQIKNILR